MRTRLILFAEKGMVLTNGDTYGTEIYLAEGEASDGYQEITQAEFDALHDTPSMEE